MINRVLAAVAICLALFGTARGDETLVGVTPTEIKVGATFPFSGSASGLANSGRWNTAGRPVTYCATVPSLAALEKRVHVGDPSRLPPQAMVAYDAPDDVSVRTINIGELPADWASRADPQ